LNQFVAAVAVVAAVVVVVVVVVVKKCTYSPLTVVALNAGPGFMVCRPELSDEVFFWYKSVRRNMFFFKKKILFAFR